MSEQIDENEQLTRLLRTLPAPGPSAEFLASARRRYLAAIEARERRQVLIGLAAALVGLAMIAVLTGATVDPAALGGWLAEAVADLARWTIGIGVVLALVPPAIWATAALGSGAAVLSMILIARAPSLASVK
jgi:hypothetical protein